MHYIIVSSLVLFSIVNAIPTAVPADNSTCNSICSYTGPGAVFGGVESDASEADCQAFCTSINTSGECDFALYDTAARTCTPYQEFYDPYQAQGCGSGGNPIEIITPARNTISCLDETLPSFAEASCATEPGWFAWIGYCTASGGALVNSLTAYTCNGCYNACDALGVPACVWWTFDTESLECNLYSYPVESYTTCGQEPTKYMGA